MKKLIKLVPTMALLLALGAYTVNAKIKAFEAEKVQTEQEWILKPGGDPTDPADYRAAPTGTKDDCEGIDEVCVVEAPSSPLSQPDFSAVPGLEEALQNGDQHTNISMAPYNPAP